MRQKKTISVVILGWIFLSLFSMIGIGEGVIVDDLDLTDFQVGDKVTYKYKNYYYQNPVMGFGWSSTRYERYVITEISDSYLGLTIKADFWDESSLNYLEVGEPQEADKVMGSLRIPPNIGDHIIPKNIVPKDYKNSYLYQMTSGVSTLIKTSIQSYGKGQGLYIKHVYEGKTIGEHKILYATTGIVLKISFEIDMGTTSDFIAEKEIIASQSTIDGADETYSEVIINPLLLVFLIGVPVVILSVVIIKKRMSKSKEGQVIKQDISNEPTSIKKSRVLCPFCFTEIEGNDIYCLNCGKKIKKDI
jgi:hypothetical protein